jgi:hypothetical protein
MIGSADACELPEFLPRQYVLNLRRPNTAAMQRQVADVKTSELECDPR